MTVASPMISSMRSHMPSTMRRVAVDRAGLDRLDRGLADHAAGLDQLHPAQRGGPAEQGVQGDLDAGHDGAAQVLALVRDDVEGGGGAEVDHDGGTAVQVVGAHRVGDAVGADLPGVVVEDRHAGLDPGAQHHGLDGQVALAHAPELVGDAGHPGGHGDAPHVAADVQVPGLQELAQQQEQLVAGPLRVGGHAPVVEQLVAAVAGVVEADDGLGVADVDDQQHGHSCCGLGGWDPSRMAAARPERTSIPVRRPFDGYAGCPRRASRTPIRRGWGQARSRPMSSTGAELVMAPTEIMSTPVAE